MDRDNLNFRGAWQSLHKTRMTTRSTLYSAMIGHFRTLGDRHLLNIAHFPKTLAGQIKPVLFSN
jgi:hypothetical protein